MLGGVNQKVNFVRIFTVLAKKKSYPKTYASDCIIYATLTYIKKTQLYIEIPQ